MICTLLLAFAAPAAPQERAPQEGYSRDQLELTTYSPRWIDAGELFLVAQQMFSRSLRVDARVVDNINVLYDSLLIYDTPEECRRILETLTTLEQRFAEAHASTDSASGLPLLRDVPVLDLRLRAIGMDAASAALEPHYRDVRARNEDGVSLSFPNIQLLDDGLLLLRDTVENLSAMRSLLERIDRSPPQVRLSAWVLKGGAVEQPERLPADLAEDLGALLPDMAFETLTRGLLTASATRDQAVSLSMRGVSGHRYDLNLITGPYDEETSRLTLASCQFYAGGEDGEVEQLFDTTTVLAAGEYAVIGLTGAEPTLLVLRMTPMR